MGRRMSPTEPSEPPSRDRALDAKIWKAFVLLRQTKLRFLRGFQNRRLPQSAARTAQFGFPAQATPPKTGFTTQQTFTHERILYTLFALFVNHILVRPRRRPGFRFLERRRGGSVDSPDLLGPGCF